MIKGIVFDWVGTLYERDEGVYWAVPGILEIFSAEYQLGLITVAGQGKSKRREELNDSGLLKYFKSVIIDKTKSEEQFRKCINELGLIPEEVAVVGDRMYREIRIGNALGCETYWINEGYFAKETPNKETGEPTRIISHIEDITDFL